MIYDSAERLMILEHYRFTAQGAWAVLLDATTLARREGKDESYWPVGVSKSTFMCIILKVRLVSEFTIEEMLMRYLFFREGRSTRAFRDRSLKILISKCHIWKWTVRKHRKKNGMFVVKPSNLYCSSSHITM